MKTLKILEELRKTTNFSWTIQDLIENMTEGEVKIILECIGGRIR